ncbi:MAG: hypothetical protein WB995_10985 [Candidatus Acidiferrales bacterium]
MNADRATSASRERIYLALLCQSRLAEPLRAELESLLCRHSWKSEDHRVVFEALAGWSTEPEAIRAGLAARLTRLGFPDTEIEEYFAPAGVRLKTALGWLRHERAAGPERALPARRAARSK